MALSVDQILNINDVDEEHRSGVHTYVHTHFPFPLLFFLLVEMCSKKREKKEKGVNYTHEEAEKKLITQQLGTVLNIKENEILI